MRASWLLAVALPLCASQARAADHTDGSASGLNSILVDTPLVDLSDEGDAQFHGSVCALPAVCASEPDIAFLIRAGTKWIANGTVLR